MVEFDKEVYYINLEALSSALTNEGLEAKEVSDVEIKEFIDTNGIVSRTEKTTNKYRKGREIDGAKYDILSASLDIVLGDNEPMDDTLGIERAMSSKPLNYIIAINTLINEGILVTK